MKEKNDSSKNNEEEVGNSSNSSTSKLYESPAIRVRNGLVRELATNLTTELTLTSATNFRIVFMKLSDSTYKLVEIHPEVKNI